MSLRFSTVRIEINNKNCEFLIGGIPKCQKDLFGWKIFDNFYNNMNVGSKGLAYVDTFLYGEDAIFNATPEEIAYLYKRIEIRPDFIYKRTTKCGYSSFMIYK